MRLIDADKLKEEWVNHLRLPNPNSWFAVEQEIASDCIAGFIQSIDEQPKVEARPVAHGHWEGEGCTRLSPRYEDLSRMGKKEPSSIVF